MKKINELKDLPKDKIPTEEQQIVELKAAIEVTAEIKRILARVAERRNNEG